MRLPRLTILLLPVLAFPALLAAQTPGTTNLLVNPSPSRYGQPVTLTATVPPFATGRVTFYDDVTVIGVAAISSGHANLSTVLLPSGPRRLRAHYLGDATYTAGNSAVVPHTVVALPSPGYGPAIEQTPAVGCRTILAADFNGDNRPDIASVNANGVNSVTVYLGVGDGTFQKGIDSPLGVTPFSAALADFNGDGIADIAVGVSTGVLILLGKGDGTFGSPVSYVAPGPIYLKVADLDNDGLVDLVMATSNQVVILRGNGDGTFGPAALFSAGTLINAMVVADFNGDGTADVAVSQASGLTFLFGDGHGGLQSPSIQPGPYSSHMAVGDFNGDGKTDLILSAQTSAALTVMLGNGDGTFHVSFTFDPLANRAPSVAVGDFDGDGNLDIAAFSLFQFDGYYRKFFLGDGTGKFPRGIALHDSLGPFNPPPAYSLAVADLDLDGRTDVIFGTGPFPYSGITVFRGGDIPDLTVAASHSPHLFQGQLGATYDITVSNFGGRPTAGAVTMVATLPAGLTATALFGDGWTCTLVNLTCVRSDALAPGSAFPPLTLRFDIARGTPVKVTSTFTVSGPSDANSSNNVVSYPTAVRPVRHLPYPRRPFRLAAVFEIWTSSHGGRVDQLISCGGSRGIGVAFRL